MSLRIVRPTCCGMDIHKDIIVATIGITDPATNITQYFMRQFGTRNHDLLDLADWLDSYHCKDVAMESTGKYWIPIWNFLESRFTICIANPKYTKAIKGKKTDKKDSKWICDLFKHDLIVPSFIPPRDIRELRELSRYRIKLVHMRSSERCRYQNAMTVSNISIGSLFSDPCGKSATRVMKEVMNNESENLDRHKLARLVSNKCKNKNTLYEDLLGYEIHSDQRMKINTCLEHFELLDQKIQALEDEMFIRAAESFPKQVQLLCSIPGIGPLAAVIILSEIGTNMDVFQSHTRLVSWCGLAPASNESAYKKKSVRISKAGEYLKPILVQCALASLNDKENPYFKRKYERIKKRRGHKKALIAIARKMMVSLFHMLKENKPFEPVDHKKVTIRKPKKPKYTIEDALNLFKISGFDTSGLEKQINLTVTPD
ncbi:IS110 family transposase [uncultured Dubosiella sp.]|uniref:IS110 family transposase n=1 Tax=uncultured Dubosiella sp. TaxID=1937011 RepID=UPI00262B6191|nr:IS110 family transposase [uncultured Dubosiella sp.]